MCARQKYKWPKMEIRPQHSWPDYKKIVHPLCGKFVPATDKYVCSYIKEKALVLDEINIHSGNQLANMSAITHSTGRDDSFREIPRDYFICKDLNIY